MRHLNGANSPQNLEELLEFEGIEIFFRKPTATNSSKNENTVKRTAFWLIVWKKRCLEKEIVNEFENYEPAELDSLLEQFYAEVKNKHGEVV